MAVGYKNTLNWYKDPGLEAEIFEQRFVYDAMNRPIEETKPNGFSITYNYNKASLLEAIYGAEGAELYTFVSKKRNQQTSNGCFPTALGQGREENSKSRTLRNISCLTTLRKA